MNELIFTCGNCKNRGAWDCEDYNWGYLDTKACQDNFELDTSALSQNQKELILGLAKEITKKRREGIMVGYISIETLHEKLNEHLRWVDNELVDNKFKLGCHATVKDIIEMIESVPSTQYVTKIVRCKDCEFWSPISDIKSNGECKCGSIDMGYSAVLYTKEDDYCSHGLFREG